MDALKGLIGGLIGGFVGAMIWALIAYFLHVEIGWIAIGVGALVGIGVTMAWSDGGVGPGVMAMGVTLFAIVAGKFVAVHFVAQDQLAKMALESAEGLVRQKAFMISEIADEIAEDREAAGEKINWPVNPGDRWEDGYPADIWSEASDRWNALTADERDAERERSRIRIGEDIADATSSLAGDAANRSFIRTFGVFDVVFFGLAMLAGYRIAASGEVLGMEV